MTWVATGWLLSTKASVSQHSLCKLRRSASSSPKPNWQSWSVAPCHNGCGRTRQSSPASSRLRMSFPPWYYLESDGTHVNQQQLCHTGLSFLLECLAIWQLGWERKSCKVQRIQAKVRSDMAPSPGQPHQQPRNVSWLFSAHHIIMPKSWSGWSGRKHEVSVKQQDILFESMCGPTIPLQLPHAPHSTCGCKMLSSWASSHCWPGWGRKEVATLDQSSPGHQLLARSQKKNPHRPFKRLACLSNLERTKPTFFYKLGTEPST